MFKRFAAIGTTLALVLAIGAAFSSEAASARSLIKAGAFGDIFSPHHSSARIGERVVWRNDDTGDLHSVTAYGGGWTKNTTLSQSEKTSVSFGQPGKYFFRCRFHSTLSHGECSGMCGFVRVGRRQGRAGTVSLSVSG